MALEESGSKSVTVRDVQLLMQKKEEIEAQIQAYYEQKGVGMNEPLVDVEGYPRADVDLYQVRTARHNIICLQNDHKALMQQVEEALHQLHARDKEKHAKDEAEARAEAMSQSLALPQPFAKLPTWHPRANHIDSVTLCFSPKGLQVDDEIVEFGSVNTHNFQSLQNIATVVQHSEGKPLSVTVIRGGERLHLGLTPKRWNGRGLLGMKKDASKPETPQGTNASEPGTETQREEMPSAESTPEKSDLPSQAKQGPEKEVQDSAGPMEAMQGDEQASQGATATEMSVTEGKEAGIPAQEGQAPREKVQASSSKAPEEIPEAGPKATTAESHRPKSQEQDRRSPNKPSPLLAAGSQGSPVMKGGSPGTGQEVGLVLRPPEPLNDNERVSQETSIQTAQEEYEPSQAHTNLISLTPAEEEKSIVSTAVPGMMLEDENRPLSDHPLNVEEQVSRVPVHTIFDSHPEGGVSAVAISHDSTLLATVGAGEVQNYIAFNSTDHNELVSNSETQVIFYMRECSVLHYFAPILTEKTFEKTVGIFSQSLFHFSTAQAITATLEGKIALWGPVSLPSKDPVPKPYNMKAIKLIYLQKDGITVLAITDRMFVTCDIKGHVKFYDGELQLLYWYSKLKIGPIRSISFSKKKARPVDITKLPMSCTLSGEPFIVRRKSGQIRGSLLGAGFANGSVYLLDSISLENDWQKPLQYSKGPLTHMVFSHNSEYFATADENISVNLYKQFIKDGEKFWDLLAALHSHYKPICALLFGLQLDSDEPRLLSLGEDRFLVEYDLANSSRDDLVVLRRDRIEQSAIPKCITWYPPLTMEYFFLTANDEYKMKIKTVLGPTYGSPLEKILVLPVKEGDDPQKRYLAYITKDKASDSLMGHFDNLALLCPGQASQFFVCPSHPENEEVGLQVLPVDGNPHKSTAFICHPVGVSNLACSYDGCHLFTAGGNDFTVMKWDVNLRPLGQGALEAAVCLGGEDLIPYYNLLEGGREGTFFKELEDYFYYAQLCHQGINTMAPRQVSTHIPLEQIPFVMRAMGFYPTEEQIESMLNEVKFSEFLETGKQVTQIDLRGFIKLYINHRPAFGLSAKEIQHAFQVLGYENEDQEMTINRNDLLLLLQHRGEHMTEEELAECLTTLLGVNPEGGRAEVGTYDPTGADVFIEEGIPEEITAAHFTMDILGLPVPEPISTEAETPDEPTSSNLMVKS
ncbi:hypothetical protein JD844_015192 [Phrynosoma platyrhinos]|uniref:Cilia- and flagella-associated protein 251 n=1 Tax=Phrynosoma platyrhinos TaxID=52577 RepID=A0ABQ7T834_PHRPL|nr:hypothetical protein JD844_015192 [Phrynosoma platyrhinos]